MHDNKIELALMKIISEMVECPAGSFMMGSPKDEYGRNIYGEGNDFETQHKVAITQPFWIGKFLITEDLYETIMEEEPINSDDKRKLNKPASQVCYQEAKTFCKKLNKFIKQVNIPNVIIPTDYHFDLPTEAQWEYACRANTTTSLNSGKNICYRVTSCPNLDELGWYEYNAFYKTHPVGQKKPNSGGIYDMHGNLSEWCRDYYLENYLPPNADPDGEDAHAQRVTRNASFRMSPSLCRSAYRFYHNSYSQGTENTFRLALVKSNKLTVFFKKGEAPNEPSHWLRRDDD
jgi:formylglycine-generating enzyme required for sulfatase activity